eukprot:3940962-Rhodomonas_salina.3
MGKGADATKHAPKRWDGKHATFPKFNLDMEGVATHFQLTYIMQTARAMFEKYNKLRETAKVTNSMAAFKTKWTEYTTAEDITMMTDVLQD